MGHDYDQYVMGQARGISAGIVQDMRDLDFAIGLSELGEGDGRYEEKREELDDSAYNVWVYRGEDGKIYYVWGLAGPHVGMTNIRITGRVNESESTPDSAILQCVQDGRWVEVYPEHRGDYWSMALFAVGSVDDLVEDLEAEEKELA